MAIPGDFKEIGGMKGITMRRGVASVASIVSAVILLGYLTCGAAMAVENDTKDNVSYSIGYNIGKKMCEGMKQDNVDVNPAILANGLTDAFSNTPALTDRERRAVMEAFKKEKEARSESPVKALSTITSKGESDRVSYSIGYNIGEKMCEGMRQDNVDVNPAILAKGLTDAFSNTPTMTDTERETVMKAFEKDLEAKSESAVKSLSDKASKEGADFLASNKIKDGVITTASGLQYKIVKKGNGTKSPTLNDEVTVNYKGTLIDGMEFDSSAKHGRSATFTVNKVIPGWIEVLQLMREGDKVQVFIPPNLAYGGSSPSPIIGPNSTLIFDIEMISINENPSSTTDDLGTPQIYPRSSGSGFFITDDGFLITNNHVVKNGAKVCVFTSSGLIDAHVVRMDPVNDLALLKVQGTFASLPIISSRGAKLGSTVATVGFPVIDLQGISPKLGKGEIASLSGMADDVRYFQISVPLQPGNSGGALVDEHGNVIGVVSAKLKAPPDLAAIGVFPENVNYAVKSSLILSFLESFPEVKLKAPVIVERKFEDVVQSEQAAAVLVLVY